MEILFAVIVVFVAIEAWLTVQALALPRSFGETVMVASKEPATQMMTVDFALFATMVALAAYLLARGSTKDV